LNHYTITQLIINFTEGNNQFLETSSSESEDFDNDFDDPDYLPQQQVDEIDDDEVVSHELDQDG
jgi:hypothetical protein